jgi:hypothetical protein
MIDLWSIVDTTGTLLGPAWSNQLDNVLDCITSVPDMVEACGLGCAFSECLAVVLFSLFNAHVINCTTPTIA